MGLGSVKLEYLETAMKTIINVVNNECPSRLSGGGGLTAVSFSAVSPGPLTVVASALSPGVPCPTGLGSPG
ncbi:MAG: hypothetical protein RXR10_03540 [Vulcanisaeta sp.]